MISNYEIRENSLTQNSVFLLFLKADEEGLQEVMEELSSTCKLTDLKVRGFNYILELPGINDESMLEKLRAKLDILSSSSLGISQTFGNNDKTKIINIDDIMTKYGEKINPEIQNIQAEDVTVTLASSGFQVTNEQKEEVDFKNMPEAETIISGDEKRIEIGATSLKLSKTVPNFQKDMPTISNAPKKQDINLTKKDINISSVEDENKTIHAYSADEMKNVSISIEKEKTGLIGNIFGKIKSAMNNKKNQKKVKPHQTAFGGQSALSELIKNSGETKQSKTTNLKQEEVPQEKNPFQDLGEGIIVKKGMLAEEENSINTAKKELTVNPVTAKLQVEDIFAAETVCDFYDNKNEGQQNKDIEKKEESPLDILEKTPDTEEKNEIPDNEEKTVSELLGVKEDIPSKNKVSALEKVTETQKEKEPEKEIEVADEPESEPQKEQTKEELTLPSKVFTKHTSNQSSGIVSPKAEDSVHKKEIQNETPINKTKEAPHVIITRQEMKSKEEEKGEKQDLPQTNTLPKEENKKMQETIKNKPLVPENKNSQQIKKVNSVQTPIRKVSEKIDHTLHVAAPAKDAKYRNYPIEMPLIPTYTFSNMDISSIRFAHAMAMATLDDLGKGNNPFLVQGLSGTGKTHFLHAMGYEISKKIPQAKILFTNGVRFSRGVQYLLEQGQKEKLDNFFSEAEVLIVDDVHLTAVNEHNREYISKILNDFLKDKKQIILSSKYPPESLKRFEELVNFKFSMGTIAELKVPSKNHFEKLTNKIVSSSFLDLTEQQINAYFTGQSHSLGDVARNVKRVKVLSRRIESSGIKKMSYEEILKEMTGINSEDQNSEIAKKDFTDITALERNKGVSWGNFGFFFPSSQIDKFRWVAFAAQEAAKELGINGGFNYALKSSYSTEHIISAAFKIANICDLKGLKGAVILGPAFVECKEPVRDNFYDILTHMLEVMMIRCGTINFEDIKKPSAYVKLLGDILK